MRKVKKIAMTILMVPLLSLALNNVWAQEVTIYPPTPYTEGQAGACNNVSPTAVQSQDNPLTILFTGSGYAGCAVELEHPADYTWIISNGSVVDGGDVVATLYGQNVEYTFPSGDFTWLMYTAAVCFDSGGAACMMVGRIVVSTELNQPPDVTLSYSPSSPVAGKPITFTADASDPDGDTLKYTWYLSGAQQGASSSSVKWSDPSVGTHSIRVVVSDGKGGEAEDSTNFTVNEAERYVIAPGLTEGEGDSWGSVFKVYIDGKEVTDAEKARLYTGSQIKTGPGVEIVIRGTNGAQTRVTENTQYEVKVVEFTEPTRKEVYGRLYEGFCDFYWPPGHEAYEKFHVETKRANTSIKGTTFTVSDIENVTTVEVEEGVVEITHLDTCAVSTVEAGESLSIEDSCRSIGADLSIPIPCAEYNGVKYGLTLNFYTNPDGQSGLYWKMGTASTLIDQTTSECIPIGSDLSLPICCAEYNGVKYGFTLNFYANPDDPSGLYWKMDSSTLKGVERLGSLGADDFQ